MIKGQWSRVTVRVTGQRSVVTDQGLLDTRPRVRDQGHGSGVTVTGQRSQVKRHRSRVMGQESVVKVQWPRVIAREHWSEIIGQRSLVSGQGSLVKGHSSVVKGHWSKHCLSSDLIRIRFSRRFASNDILKTINFQVHDLDLQVMGGDGTEKNFRPISIITP